MHISKNTIITMVMIVLVIIINILITKFISTKINPEERIDELNEQIDELNSLTDRMNEYLDSQVKKQTQKVIDVDQTADQDELKRTTQSGAQANIQSEAQANTSSGKTQASSQNEAEQANTPNGAQANSQNVVDQMFAPDDATTNNIQENANQENTNQENTQNEAQENTEQADQTNASSEVQTNVEDTVIQQNISTNNISSSQTNNVNCFVRTLTIDNINMFNNGSLEKTTIQTAIEQFVSNFNTNFEDLNLLPIGSVIYTIIPIHVNNDIFVYGRYYIRSLVNSNDPIDSVYTYQLQLPEHWPKGMDFRFPNMKDRALQGKSRINFNLTDSEHKIESNNEIDISTNAQEFTHTELKAVDFPTNNATQIKAQKGVLTKAAFWIKRELESKLEHGSSLEKSFTPKVLDQSSKLFYYVILGYVQSV